MRARVCRPRRRPRDQLSIKQLLQEALHSCSKIHLIFQHPPSHTASTGFLADTRSDTNVSFLPAVAPVTHLLGIGAKNIIVCPSCKAVGEKENMAHVVDIIYPRKVYHSLLARVTLY